MQTQVMHNCTFCRWSHVIYHFITI